MNLPALRAKVAGAVAPAVVPAPNLDALKLYAHPELADAKAEWEARERLERQSRKAMREGETGSRYGMESGAANCQSCGTFKSDPASVCSVCGDDPVSYNG